MPPTVSYATVNTANMDLTPCQVLFDSGSGPVDLGGTLKNVEVAPKYTKSDIKADQLGTTVLDRRVSGLEIQVTTEVAEILLKTNWDIVFPHATPIVVGPKTAIQFNSAVGDSDQGNAGKLTLHPLSQAPTVVDFDHTFYKACSSADSKFVLSPTEQQALKIVWNVLPDLTVNPPRFYRFGDTTI
jgi:hypothetical protein